MGKILPILFNTEMVRAILDGRKTVTRRLPTKHVRYMWSEYDELSSVIGPCDGMMHYMTETEFYQQYPPCQPGCILYVRETWNYGYIETSDSPGNFEAWFEPLCPDERHGSYIEALGSYFYKADEDALGANIGMVWRPSIHMPKQAARIWLKVTGVRLERLQEITIGGCEKEGCWCGQNGDIFAFMALWDSTIKKADIERYGWEANPRVWVIEFERCEKPESVR